MAPAVRPRPAAVAAVAVALCALLSCIAHVHAQDPNQPQTRTITLTQVAFYTQETLAAQPTPTQFGRFATFNLVFQFSDVVSGFDFRTKCTPTFTNNAELVVKVLDPATLPDAVVDPSFVVASTTVLDTSVDKTVLNFTAVSFASCASQVAGVTFDTTTYSPFTAYAVDLNAATTNYISTLTAEIQPKLQATGAILLSADPGATLTVNDVIWLVVKFTGKVDEPLPAGCTPYLSLNTGGTTATNVTWNVIRRATAIDTIGNEDVITDNTIVLSRKILAGEVTSGATLAVAPPIKDAMKLQQACSVPNGMRFFSTTTKTTGTQLTPEEIQVTGFYLSPISDKKPYISSVAIDTLPSVLQQISTKRAAATLYAGDVVDIFCSFDKAVTVFVLSDGTSGGSTPFGKPYLDLNSGGTASYIGLAPRDNTTLVFRYVVGSGESTPAGQYLDVSGFSVNGALLSSPNGLDASPALPKTAATSLASGRLLVNRSSSIVSLRIFGAVGGGADVFSIGDILRVVASFDDAVADEALDAPGCAPTLATSLGLFRRIPRASFNLQVGGPIATETQLIFQRPISDSDGVIDSIAISKPYDKAMNLTGCPESARVKLPVQIGKAKGFYPIQAASNGLTADVRTDTIPATIVAVSSKIQNRRVGPGEAVDILVTFSKPVKFAILTDAIRFTDPDLTADSRRYGTPRIVLNAPAYAYLMDYANSDSKTTLIFRYTVDVGEGEKRFDAAPTGIPVGSFLDVNDALSLELYGGSIRTFSNSIDANLALPVGTQNSLANSRIRVARVGYKVPPFGTNPDVIPGGEVVTETRSFGASGRRRVVLGTVAAPGPVRVKVLVQFNSIFDITEKTQQFKADTSVVQEWYDPKFNTPFLLPPLSENTTSALTAIWYPRLTIINLRERLQPFDQRVLIFNNGTVQIHERYVMAFSNVIDARAFPFDTQTFGVQFRSMAFNMTQMTFVPVTPDLAAIQEEVLKNLKEPSFAFSGYVQSVKQVGIGAFGANAMLTVAFTGTRIATFNVINVVLPLLFICLSVCASFSMPIRSDSRLSVCTGSLAATLAFTYVVAQLTPPVNYMTKMGRLTFQAYAFAIAGTFLQVFIRYMGWVIDECNRKIFADKGDERSRIYENLLDLTLGFKKKMRKEDPSLLAKLPDEPAAAAPAPPPPLPPPPVATGPSVRQPEVLVATTPLPELSETSFNPARLAVMQAARVAPAPPSPPPQPAAKKEEPKPKWKTTAGVVPNVAKLTGTNEPTVPERDFYLFDFQYFRFKKLVRARREVYLDRLYEFNFWVRLVFYLAFIIATACNLGLP